MVPPLVLVYSDPEPEPEPTVVAAGEWADRANCLGLDPDLFFPERGESTKEAREVCHGCDVRAECLEYALDNGEKHGIWGGLSERERRRIRRTRHQAGRAAEIASLPPLASVPVHPVHPDEIEEVDDVAAL